MTSEAFHVDPYWTDKADTPRSRAKPSRIRHQIVDRRKNQHPFVASSGHPSLCAHCNAGKDDLHRDVPIHP